MRLMAVGSICDSGMALFAPPALGECWPPNVPPAMRTDPNLNRLYAEAPVPLA